MELRVDVADVNEAPVPYCTCTINYVEALTFGERIGKFTSGQIADFNVNAAVPRIQLRVDKPDYSPEIANIDRRGNDGWQTDNPSFVPRSTSNGLAIKLTLGCLRYAPVAHISDETEAGVCDNPRGVLATPDGQGAYRYRDLYLNDETICRLNLSVFGDPESEEWKRLSYESHLVILKNFGQFLFLEQGFPAPNRQGRPRLLLAVWAPSKPLGTPVNVIVFYSPNTAADVGYPADSYPYAESYPYRFRLRTDEKMTTPCSTSGRVRDLIQPYPGLAIRYLVSDFKMMYQLIAAGRNPIVVMPVQASANWGPWLTRSGVGRTIREVVRFLFAKRYVAIMPQEVSRVRLDPKGTSEILDDKKPANQTLPSDESLRITVSGYSAALSALISLCDPLLGKPTEELARKYPTTLFSSPERFLNDRWVELWDIDANTPEGPPWDRRIKTFKTWKSFSQKRVIRSYHSQYTLGLDKQKVGLVDSALIDERRAKSDPSRFVQFGETSDKSITWVGFSIPYLSAVPGLPNHMDVLPAFGVFDGLGVHHFVPRIAFGHAAQYEVPR
jgi:hypothetical protein